MSIQLRIRTVAGMLLATLLAGAVVPASQARIEQDQDPDQLMVVDCLLPGKIRKLGMMTTYLTARRPVRTTAQDCEIRGGEYTSYDRANYATALKVWLPQAKEGNAEAANYVGQIYEKGLGLEPDYQAAAHWYQVAAEAGDSSAQINLGHLYEQGLGVSRDPLKAMQWYRRASGLEEAILIDPGTLNATHEEVQTLRAEVAQAREAEAELRRQLDDTRRQLEDARRGLQSRKQTLDAERRGLEQARRELEHLKQQASTPREQADVAQKEKQLQDKEKELARMRREVEELRERVAKAEQEKARYQEQVALAEKASQMQPASGGSSAQRTASIDPALLAAPSVEIIDPPIVVTRGIPQVQVRSVVESRKVVGRVEAPAGLLSLLVNDQSAEPNENGVFEAMVPIVGKETPVTVSAVDKAGKRAQVEFKFEFAGSDLDLTPGEMKAVPVVAQPLPVQFGNYHALLIGNNDYQHLPKLQTAINDVRAIGDILRERYGFQVTVVEDATRYQILSELNKLRETLTSDDNLLIYYAGHGVLDEVNMRGQWLPVDAEPDSNANWISNVAITDILNVIKARQVLLVADSCYSGALTRSAMAHLKVGLTEKERINWFKAMLEKRSRTVLTSGGLKPVLDAGGGRHSVFAKSFIDVLNANVEIMEGQRLFREVSARVAYAASRIRFKQLPEYAPLQHAGHEAGDFFLVPRMTQAMSQ